MTIYMLLAGDLGYLVRLGQDDQKGLKAEEQKESFLQKLPRPFLNNFLAFLRLSFLEK